MDKKKKQYPGDEPKGVTVQRQAHKRYEKAQRLRDERKRRQSARAKNA